MAKQKYNRPELKRKRLESEHIELSERIKAEFGKWNWTINEHTAGRREMKDRYKEELERKALERTEREKIKSLMIPKSQYYEMKKELIEGMIEAIHQEMDLIREWKWDIYKLRELLKMVKAELLEPSNITQTNSTIKNEELPLSDEDQELLSSLIPHEDDWEDDDW